MRHFGGKYLISYIIFGTVLLVPFVYLPLWSVFDFFYYPKYLTLVLITTLLLLILLFNRNQLNKWIHFDRINCLLLIYFILITVSLFFSMDINTSVSGNFLRYDGYTTQIMYIILFLFARTINSIPKRFIVLIVLSSTFVSLYGIIQYLGFDPFIRDLTRLFWTSAFSTFGNQNFFGSYLVLQLPFSIYLIVFSQKKWAYVPYGITFLALLMTMTRSAWIGYFVGLVAFIISVFVQKKFNKSVIYLLIYTLLIILGFNLFMDNQLYLRLYSVFLDTKTLLSTNYANEPDKIDRLGSIRMFIWIRVVELIRMRPIFGFGLENLHLAFLKYYEQDIIRFVGRVAYVDKAHNDYLHIAVSSGIPSLIAYLTYLLSIASQSLKRINNPIYLIVFVSILSYAACLFFNISVVSVAYIFWIYLGLFCSYDKQ